MNKVMEDSLLNKSPILFEIPWYRGMAMEDVERITLLKTLAVFEGNRTYTSRALNISVRTLRNKLRHYRSDGFHIYPTKLEALKQSKGFGG